MGTCGKWSGIRRGAGSDPLITEPGGVLVLSLVAIQALVSFAVSRESIRARDVRGHRLTVR